MGLGLALLRGILWGPLPAHPHALEASLNPASCGRYARPFEWKRWMRMQKERMGEVAFEEWLLEIEPIAIQVARLHPDSL